MAATITLVGGETARTGLPGPLGSALNQAAQNAMTALGQGFTNSEVLHARADHPVAVPGLMNVYNIPGGPPAFHLPSGAEAVILTGSKATKITGHGGAEVLIGNGGRDTISAGGGFGTIIGGNAGNDIIAGGGPHFIEDGTGKDTVNLTGGQDTVISLGGNDQVHISHTDLMMTGKADIIGKGHDTITLGSGSVVEAGAATVTGAGPFKFDAHTSHGAESVLAGAGRNTLIGGHGTNFFQGGAGFSSMVAGTGSHDTFVGGTGNSVMDAQNARVLFQFDSSHAGGFHTIAHFTHGKDTIDLHGYDSAQVHTHVQGHNTIINLDDGTKIVLKGFTHLKPGDIEFN